MARPATIWFYNKSAWMASNAAATAHRIFSATSFTAQWYRHQHRALIPAALETVEPTIENVIWIYRQHQARDSPFPVVIILLRSSTIRFIKPPAMPWTWIPFEHVTMSKCATIFFWVHRRLGLSRLHPRPKREWRLILTTSDVTSPGQIRR